MKATARTILMAARICSAALLLALAALVVTTGVGGVLGTAAEPITSPSGDWTPAGFKDSCNKVGGLLREDTDSNGNVVESHCTFSDGSFNECDWVNKTCTSGPLVALPRGPRDELAQAGGATDGSGPAGGAEGAGPGQSQVTGQANAGGHGHPALHKHHKHPKPKHGAK